MKLDNFIGWNSYSLGQPQVVGLSIDFEHHVDIKLKMGSKTK